MAQLPKERLRVGFVGTGFIAQFHLKSLVGVRNIDVVGVYSRSNEKRAHFVKLADELGLGACKNHDSLESLLGDPTLDAVWVLSPNYTRLDVMRTLHAEVKAGRSKVFAVACESRWHARWPRHAKCCGWPRMPG